MQLTLSKRKAEILLHCVQSTRRKNTANLGWAKNAVFRELDEELAEVEKILVERLTPLPPLEDEINV
jgi:hypothetical protein